MFREITVTDAGVCFRVWSPKAEAVSLRLWSQADGDGLCGVTAMSRQPDGFWSLTMPLAVRGRYYDFRVRTDGRWGAPTPGLFAVAVGVNGRRGFVLDLKDTDPEGWAEDAPPPLVHPADAVIYEMHHRDFSVSSDSGIFHKGKFLALTERNVHAPDGTCSGLDHLVELGVTHVHLLPSFDFASVDESRTDRPQYNWGYDPQNYNVPEGSYATDPFDPACRIREFKQMVMALHQAGLRVVLDVVYNHTYTVDGSNFEALVPGYFFRRMPDGTLADGSGCGNETASEREGMRRFMVESVCFWAREYHVDGFRFDTMGLHDLTTMGQIRDALLKIDPVMLLYGEGWSARPARLPAWDCAVKEYIGRLPGVAAFGDELRDGIRGWWTQTDDGGFLSGRPGYAESVKFGIVGGVAHPGVDCRRVNHASSSWAGAPWQMVNYVSCHDDWCLTDRLAAVFPHLPEAERLKLYKLAETLLFTSQGIPMMFAGDEMYRSKQGDRNSYKSPDAVNAIPWRNKGTYRELFQYVCGLIRLRRTHAAFRMRSAAEVVRRLHFLPVYSDSAVAYRLDENSDGESARCLYLFFNADVRPLQVALPHRPFTVLCREGKISADGLDSNDGGILTVAPRSALILASS